MSAEAAKEAAWGFLNSFNNQDAMGVADSCNFPHVRLANGEFTRIETHAEFMERSEGGKKRLEEEGWATTVTESMEVIQEGPDKVHLAIYNTRRKKDGTVYDPFHAFWIATLKDGHWGIQFRSSYLDRPPKK